MEIRPAGLEHAFRGRVVEQRQQQVLDRHVLVARLAGALVALADAVLEVLAEHGGLASWKCVDRGRSLHSMRGGGRDDSSPFYAFFMVQSNGCWLSLEYSFTWATLDSATSRVKTPQTPRPRVWTWSMTWVAFSMFMPKKRASTPTTKSMGV